jgi:hypothetical protein
LKQRLLSGWQAIAGRFGAVQTTVLLALFYLTLVGPVAIAILAARRDLLDKRTLGEGDTAWSEAHTAGADFERAQLTS